MRRKDLLAVVFRQKRLFGKERWRFHILAGNGEIIAQSEGYQNKVDAYNMAQLLLPSAAIREE